MAGDIGVDRQPGTGGLFWFTARMLKSEAIVASSHVTPGTLEGLSVLIVDDNATNRTILQHRVGAWGMLDESAVDGPSALTLLRAAAQMGKPHDIAILDMQMPGMDGVTLARVIRSDPAFATVRLVLLSSIGQDLESAQRVNLDGVLTKPVRQSLLYDCLVTALCGSPAAVVAQPEARSLMDLPSPAVIDSSTGSVILLAEDSVINQHVAAAMLRKLGYDVDLVNDGSEAIAAAARTRYDAILMDCHMPELDGYEATAAIRGQEHGNRHTPIIAMTANALDGDRERCLAAGMDDYLSKPISSERLGHTLGRWISVKTTSVENPDISATSPLTSEVAVDVVTLQTLKDLQDDDDPDLVADLVTIFLADAPQRLTRARETAASHDAAVLEREAHTLRGSAASLVAQPLANLSGELQSVGLTHGGMTALALLDRLDEEFERVRVELMAYTKDATDAHSYRRG